jgi:hypothetical protein
MAVTLTMTTAAATWCSGVFIRHMDGACGRFRFADKFAADRS